MPTRLDTKLAAVNRVCSTYTELPPPRASVGPGRSGASLDEPLLNAQAAAGVFSADRVGSTKRSAADGCEPLPNWERARAGQSLVQSDPSRWARSTT